MNIPDDALLLLQCPITRRSMANAIPALLDRVNHLIDERRLTNRLGDTVEEFFDGGLVDRAGTWLYAVRDGIVCLLADEAIPVERLGIKQEDALR